MARINQYHLKEEMRRLADSLFELTTLYKADNPEIALAACKEARMLATLGYEVEGGKQVGEIASSALLQLSHQRKIEAAVAKRKAVTLPLDMAFEKNVTAGGANGQRP